MKIFSGAAVRGEGDVAGEGELVGVPKFHSWDKCTMASGLHYTTRVLYFTSSGEITLREFFNSHLGLVPCRIRSKLKLIAHA